MKHFSLSIKIVLLCLSLGVTGVYTTGLSGCTTSQKAVAYKTLQVTALTVDSAIKSYADRLVAGKVSQATQIKVVAAKTRYEMAFKLAVDAARGDLTQTTPAQVQELADQLTTLLKAIL